MAEIGKNIDLAAGLLKQGKLVAIPTETVYGLAALATYENAVLSIFEAKNRPFFDPLIIHVPSIKALEPYAKLNHPTLLKLAARFWPGPLTLLLPKTSLIPDLVTSGLDHVAVRVPDHPLTLEVLNKINAPLAAPSANPFGYVSPTEPSHVNAQLGDKVGYILDGGVCTVGLESTIVGMEGEEVFIYRLGGLTVEDIEKEVGKVTLRVNQSGDPKVPGQLKSHYAPRKTFILGNLEQLVTKHASDNFSIICFGEMRFKIPDNKKVYHLSRSADLKEASINLFRLMREADQDGSEMILCEKLPDHQLGKAINDRLIRAAAQG